MTQLSNCTLAHSHLLRMWAEPSTCRPPTWRFSLEDVATGQRTGFANLDELISHLLELMDPPAAPLYYTPTSLAPGLEVGN